MAANEVEKKETDGEKTVTESTWKRLMKIGEFRMLIYVIPIAIFLAVVGYILSNLSR